MTQFLWKNELNILRQTARYNLELSRKFITKEIIPAVRDMKTDKAPGVDGIHYDFFLQCGQMHESGWLKSFRESKVVAVM